MSGERRLKIVVFGAFGAGKTTMIHAIDPGATHIEANCAGGTTTVALDFGRIREGDLLIHLYGTPGQERFSFARAIIARGMDGAILLADVTTHPDELILHLFRSLHEAGVPVIVFLNRFDSPGADPGAFAGLSGPAEIRSISARDGKQCRDAVLAFAVTLGPAAGRTSR